MKNSNPEPTPRKERKLSHLTLFFPVTKKIGNISIYKFDATGMRLVRALRGCRTEG